MARPLAVLGLLCLGCATGQIGGEIDARDPNTVAETSDSCTVISETPLEPNDPSFGFDAEALVQRVDGLVSHEQLAWGRALTGDLVLTPTPGTTTVDVSVVYVADTLRRVERGMPAPLEENTGGGPIAEDGSVACDPLVAFDADVTLVAENGAFSDVFRAMFVVSSPDVVTATFEVMPGQLTGSFDLDTESGVTSGRARFDLDWTDGHLSGCLSASAVDGDVASYVEVARFPEASTKD